MARYQASARSPSDPQIEHNGAPVAGLKTKGNINFNGRPMVANSDGSYSSEKSFSRGTDKGEILVPKIVKGQELSEDAAWSHYKNTGEHMGIFDTPEHADAYAQKTHSRTMKDSSGKINYEAEAAIHPAVSSTPVPKELSGG